MTVGIYARLSTKLQTTDNQLIRLNEWADRKGWENVDRYVDVASGRNTHRPELNRMMDDAKHHRFDTIIAVKLDRIGRSVIDLKGIMEKLQSWDVGIKMMDQDIDTATASGRFMITMLSAVAEFEREIIVERIDDGLNRARKEGKTLGRPRNTLSKYQIEKAKQILAENPSISQRKLAEQFDGIGRKQLISQLKDLGILEDGSKSLSEGVYKGGSEKGDGADLPDSAPSEIEKEVEE